MKKRFTLIELLVVIAIITILAAMLLPALAKARKNSLNSACQSNMKQIGIGMLSYIGDFKDFFPPYCLWTEQGKNNSPGVFSFDYMARSWSGKLYGVRYIADPKVFLCPSIMLEVTPDTDTDKFAKQDVHLNDLDSPRWGGITYAYNNLALGSDEFNGKPTTAKLNQIKQHSRVMVMFDGGYAEPNKRYGVHAVGTLAVWSPDYYFYNLLSPHGSGSMAAGKNSTGATNILYADGHVAGLNNAQQIVRNPTYSTSYLSRNPRADRPF